MWHFYSKSQRVFHFTSWQLTFVNIERYNQGVHYVIGLYMYFSSYVFERRIYRKSYDLSDLSVYIITFDLVLILVF